MMPLLGIYPSELTKGFKIETHTQIFIAELLTVVKKKKQSHCSCTGERTDKYDISIQWNMP